MHDVKWWGHSNRYMVNVGLTNGDTYKVTAWLRTSESGLYSLKILRTWQKISHRPGTDTSNSWQASCALSTFWNLLSEDTFQLSFCLLFACDGNPECSLERLMLKLKLQHFGHLMRTADPLEKSLMLGKIESRGEEGIRGWDGWMASPTQRTWTWENFGRWWRTVSTGVLQSMGSQRVGHNWATKQQKQDDARQLIH